MTCKPNCPCGQNPEQRPVPASAEAHELDRDEAIRIWRRHCAPFSRTLWEAPPSVVIDAMMAFAKANVQPKHTDAELESRTGEPHIDGWPLYSCLPPAQPSVPEATGRPACNPHPKAPHGFNRSASHNAGRYVCDCEGWDAWNAGYEIGLRAGLDADEPPSPAPVDGNRGDRDAQEQPFEDWWEQDGQYCRAGGGQYEKTFAWNAWCAASNARPEQAHADLLEQRLDAIAERARDAGWDVDRPEDVAPLMQVEIDKLTSALAACRDAFPMPEHGAAHEQTWMLAMSDPLEVPAYVRAALEFVSAPAVKD